LFWRLPEVSLKLLIAVIVVVNAATASNGWIDRGVRKYIDSQRVTMTAFFVVERHRTKPPSSIFLSANMLRPIIRFI
jgi:hypothetical protein